MNTITLTQDQIESVVREDLVDCLGLAEQDEDDPALIRALHVVIAYYSVPGTYMEGAYDS